MRTNFLIALTMFLYKKHFRCEAFSQRSRFSHSHNVSFSQRSILTTFRSHNLYSCSQYQYPVFVLTIPASSFLVTLDGIDASTATIPSWQFRGGNLFRGGNHPWVKEFEGPKLKLQTGLRLGAFKFIGHSQSLGVKIPCELYEAGHKGPVKGP